MRALMLLAIVLAAACGKGPIPTQGTDAAVTPDASPANDRLYVARTNGGLTIVDLAADKAVRDLPPGVMAPDRSAYWTVEPGPTTIVRKLDPASGQELTRYAVNGTFDLPRGYGPLADAISSNGRFLTLTRPGGDAFGFTVIDLRDGMERGRATLRGSFTFDAIDDLGGSLYLLEHPQPSAPERYNVRLFDLLAGALLPSAIVDQKAAVPTAADLARGTMGGLYHASAVAGAWHFGVYTNVTKGPVVHALNMTARFASCLFDVTSATSHPSAWAIATTPARAFVVNAASGAFVSIDAGTLMTAKRTFSVEPGAEAGLRGSAVVTPDGKRLYATGGKGIVVVDAHTLSMKAQYLTDRQFTSVIVSSDGSRLYAMERSGAIARIDPATGREVGIVVSVPSAVSTVRID